MSDSERIVQSRVLTYFRGNLAYREIGNLKEQENRNIREADLLHFLTVKKSYDKKLARKAITLRKLAVPRASCIRRTRTFINGSNMGCPWQRTLTASP